MREGFEARAQKTHAITHAITPAIGGVPHHALERCIPRAQCLANFGLEDTIHGWWDVVLPITAIY